MYKIKNYKIKISFRQCDIKKSKSELEIIIIIYKIYVKYIQYKIL